MSPNAQTTGLPPIEWPVVTIGGQAYTVKYSQLSEYMVSKWGYELAELLNVLKTEGNDPRRFSYVMQLFAACVAHQFPPPQIIPTAEQWMAMIPEDDATIFGEIGKAVILALVKRLSERMKKAGATPTAEQAPAATPVQ